MALRLGTLTVTISLGDGRGSAEREIPAIVEEGCTPWEVLDAAILKIQKDGMVLAGKTRDLEQKARDLEARWFGPDVAATPLRELLEGLDTCRGITDDLERLGRWTEKTGDLQHTLRYHDFPEFSPGRSLP